MGVTIGEIYASYIDDRASEGKSTKRMEDAWKRLGEQLWAPETSRRLEGRGQELHCRQNACWC